jgi:hypothetical protein
VDLGVRISTVNMVLARQFARAMDFRIEILDLEWHKVDSPDCSIQLVGGTPGLFDLAAIAALVPVSGQALFPGLDRL